jgi:hypothetical protein
MFLYYPFSSTRKALRKERMSYVESNLVPGKELIYQTRLHWIVMLSTHRAEHQHPHEVPGRLIKC